MRVEEGRGGYVLEGRRLQWQEEEEPSLLLFGSLMMLALATSHCLGAKPTSALPLGPVQS